MSRTTSRHPVARGHQGDDDRGPPRPRRHRRGRGRHRPARSSTTCSPSSAATAASTSTSRPSGDLDIDAHHTVEDVGIALGEAFARGAGRQGRRAPLRLRSSSRSTRPWSRSPSTCRAGPFLRLRGRRPGGDALGDPAVRPPAGRGVLAGVRHRRRASPSTSTCAAARTPTTSSRPRSRAWPGRCATPCGSRAAASRPPRARCDAADAAVIAVLDYGIGNLRSAQKALQHVGADAGSPPTRPWSRRPPAWCCPAWAPSAGAWRRCGQRASRTSAREAIDAGTPVPRHLRRHADALRRLGGGPGRRGPRRPARHGPPAARRGQAAADAVEHPRPAGPSAPVRRPRRSAVGVLRPLLRPRAATTTWSPPATTAARSSPPSSGDGLWATQFHPEKSGADGLRAPGQLRVPPCSLSAVMDLYPAIDLRGGRVVRLYQGDYDRETVYGDDPVAVAQALRRRRRPLDPRRRPRRRPHRRAREPAGDRGHRRRASACAVQTGGGVRDQAAAEALLARRRRPGRDRHRRRRATRARAPSWPPPPRPGGGRARRPGPRGRRCGAGRRARASTCSTCWPGFEDGGVAACRHRDRPRRHPRRPRPRRAWPPSCEATDGRRDRLRRRRHRSTDLRALATLEVGRPPAWPGSSSGRPSTRAASPWRRRCRHARRPGDPLPRRRRRPGRQGRQLRRTCATPATRSSWPPATTPRAPTSSSSSTSPPAPTPATPWSTWPGARPSRSSSPSPSAAASARSTTPARCCGPGADKVCVNTAAVDRPELVAELAAEFGAQCVVVAIDARRRAGDAAGRSSPTAAARRPASTPSPGPRSARRWAPARSCSPRWTATAPRTATTCELTRAVCRRRAASR